MTIGELTEACRNGTIDEVIRVAETRQVKTLGHIADAICARPAVRFVLLAGASAAGKTTTAKRLCTQLRVNGREAVLLSTDDYFVDSDRTPRTPEGKPDFEHVESIDIPRFVADLTALARGETICARRFDFHRHAGFDSDVRLSVPADGYVVIEGIHALNPRLTETIADERKFRLFVEPKTQPTLFALTNLTVVEGRFLRRLVRDFHYRKLSPVETYRLWPNVLAGEKLWIEPFRPLAEVEFDSGLGYELLVLKPYVEGPLRRMKEAIGDDPEINKLIEILESVPVVSPNAVPGNSILRETIGGSQLEY